MLKKLTDHALLRMQQRGKNVDGVKQVLRHGVRRDRLDGVMLRRKDAMREIERRQRWLARLEKRGGNRRVIKAMRRRIQNIERMRGCVVVSKDGNVITVYNRTRKFKK